MARAGGAGAEDEDAENGGIRREPGMPDHEAVAPETLTPASEFAFGEEDQDEDAAAKARVLTRQFGYAVRQAPLDPADGLAL
jgi:type IV secretion system protein VirD4